MRFARNVLIASSVTIAGIFVLLILNIDSLWTEVLLYVLLLFLLVLPCLTFKKIRELEEKEKAWNTHFQQLEKQYHHLENVANKAQYTENQYYNLYENLDLFVFTIDFAENKWVISTNREENSGKGIGSFQLGIRFIEERIHEEDKASFLQKKNQWLLSSKPAALTYEFRTLSENGEVCWHEFRMKTLTNSLGVVEKATGMIIDITQRKEKETKLAQMAFYDALTELPNRMMLKSHLKKALSRAKRKQHEVIIMFLDLDGFKNVNDTLGHDAGDTLLKDVAERLVASVREEDMVSRIGGDEFIIAFEETGKQEVTIIAERIIEMVSNPYFISGQEINVTPSIGISIYPEHGEDLNTVVTHADTAMYVAKSKGKGRFQFYSSDLEDYEHSESSLIGKFLKLFHK